MYKGKRVMVTGGTGMIGAEVVRMLLERGAHVRVASLDDPSRAGRDVEFLRGNLMEWEFCKQAVAGMDCVFHLAGIKGSVGIGNVKAASFLVPHLLMNTLVMEAARQAGVDRYLFTSSIAV
jgi:GDP-L-fucose synthase